MDPQFRELVDEINKGTDERLNHRFGFFEERFVAFEQRQEQRMQMHFESLEELVKATADGYGMNLDRIERKIDALSAKVEGRLADHDLVLANHNERITNLEKN